MEYQNFDRLLKSHNTTAYRVAKGTGIAPSTFSDWKSGRSVPKADKLRKIAAFLGVSVEALIGDGTVPEREAPLHDLFDFHGGVGPRLRRSGRGGSDGIFLSSGPRGQHEGLRHGGRFDRTFPQADLCRRGIRGGVSGRRRIRDGEALSQGGPPDFSVPGKRGIPSDRAVAA